MTLAATAALVVAMLAALGLASPASAAGSSAFVADARAAGLSTVQATGLQQKVNDYLVELDGRGAQVSPNQIDLGGAVLNVAVPGENRPRPLGDVSAQVYNAYECTGWTSYGWFCAYKYQNRTGDNIGMYSCGHYSIPWVSTGSWVNNQTTGTRPMMYYTNTGSELLPPAYSKRDTGVNWAIVSRIRNCD
ncbi:hypothetical protein AB0L99_44205 [Streptomyces sp. NPDC051954]|uniref:hypothetical protein n=1 Tax=unclassified Streptomyces TaxID=2593676 RepID=UPI00344861AF